MVVGSNGDDTLNGTAASDTIYGFDGDDLLSGYDGNDTIYGGDGNDRLYGGAGDDYLCGFDGVDSVYGGGGNDTLHLGAGNDYARASAGTQSFYGGDGKDYISYYDSPEGITINLAANTVTGSWASNDLIDGFESVGGSKTGDDTMYGTSGANIFKGYGGDDRFYGGAGNDKIYGNSGDDYVRVGGGVENFYGGSGTDYISYYDSTGGITIDLAANSVSGSWANNDTIDSFEGVSGSDTGGDTITGTSEANILRGYGGDDSFYGGPGKDKIYGGDGDDYIRVGGGVESFYGGDGTDHLDYYSSSGGITVDLSIDFITGSWANNDVIGSFESFSGSNTGNDTITGTSEGNTLHGNGGDDRFYGGVGADTIYGGSGDDYVRVGGGVESFYGGSGTDYISYYDSTRGITIDLAANSVSGSWAVNDVIDSFESVSGSKVGNDNITGTSGANTLRGYGGDDDFYGGSGSDKIYGGDGDDYIRVGGGVESFYGGSGFDYISYYDSSGGIIIDLEADSVSGGWAVNDVMSGFEGATGSNTGDDKMYGTSGGNRLRSYHGDDSLYGRSGDDTLFGGHGVDRFDGGHGDDTLYGGDGADIFHFDHTEDADIIKDFENNIDTIQLDNFGYADAAEALTYATESGGDVIFDFGGGDILTVENTSRAALLNDLEIV